MSVPSVPPDVNATELERCRALPPLDQFRCVEGVISNTPQFANLSTCTSRAIAIPVSNNATCPLGMYCPRLNESNPTTYPQVCPPTLECQILRLANTWCEPQGLYEPAPCLPGHYCPNSSVQLPCPAGTWCVRGTVQPRACQWLTLCPERTTVGRHYGGALLAVIIDVILLAAYVYHTRVHEPWRVRVQAAKRREKLTKAAQLQAALALSMPAAGTAAHAAADKAAAAAAAAQPQVGAAPPGGPLGSLGSFGRATSSALAASASAIDSMLGGGGGGGGGSAAGPASRTGRVQRMASSVRRRPHAPSDASSEELSAAAASGSPPRRTLGRAVRDDGTLVADDDQPVEGGGSVLDRIVTSSATLVLEHGFRKCNAGLTITLQFDGMGLTLPPPVSKTILSDVSGEIRPGRVTAVMGPSGAGKTTFLSVLMGKVRRTNGTLRINGQFDEISAYRQIIGFVPQEDTMLRELTVRENILFSARVRLPRQGWPDATVQRFVDAVIEVLGLSGCADTPTSLVSGGQRKRCNIGMELAVAPAALFLDEPTSGLDSAAALEVCRTLRSIADLGLTVVAVVHQPRAEIFRSFDDLLLLAPGGHTVYMGPTAGTTPYFSAAGLPPCTPPAVAAPAEGAATPTAATLPPLGEPLSRSASCHVPAAALAALGSPVLGDNNPADELLDLVAGSKPLRVTTEALVAAGFAAPDDKAAAAAPFTRVVHAGVPAGSSSSPDGVVPVDVGGDDHAVTVSCVRNPLHAAAAAAAARPPALDGGAAPEVVAGGQATAAAPVVAVGGATAVVALQGREVAEYLIGRWKAFVVERDASAARTGSAGGGGAFPAPAPHWQTLRVPLGIAQLELELPTDAWFKSMDPPLNKAVDAVRPRALSAALLEAGAAGQGALSPSPLNPQRAKLEAMIATRGATPWRQLWLCHQRSLTQQYRQISWLAAECAVTSLAGMFMGLAATGVLDELYNGVLQPPYTIISPAPADHIVVSFAFYISMALGVAGAPAAVRTFGEERDVFLREAARGHSALAYFSAKNISALYRMALAALHFAATFTMFAMPAAQFHQVLLASTLNLFGVYGMGTLVSMLLSRENAALVGVVVALILSCMCGFGPNLNLGRDWGLIIVQDLSYTRWMAEFWIHAETLAYRHLFMVKEVTAAAWGYELDRPVVDAVVMVVLGCALRLLAFGGLLWVAWRASKGTR